MAIIIFKLSKKLNTFNTVSTNLENTLKCFLNIFFINKMIRVHLLFGFFIRINKRLTRFTILVRCAVVLAIRRITESIET